MSLPPTVPRCPGQPRDQEDCLMHCERRRQGIADYMAGAKVEWMRPPVQTPCPERLEAKR